MMNPRRRWLGATAALGLLGAGLPAPAFAAEPRLWAFDGLWDDDARQHVRLARWAGRPALLALAYGACRKTCSTTLRLLQQAQADADARGIGLDVIVVSLDPATDTPQAWRAFRAERGLLRPNWHFLAGPPAQTRRLADLLGVRYWVYDDHVLHDFRIVAVHPDGHIVARMQWVDEPVAALVDAIAAAGAPSAPG